MEQESRVAPVRNADLQFASFRPPGARTAMLDRRVQVVAPPALVELSRTGDVALLDELVPLLAVRDRAWAAEVLLAAMTGHEAELVANYTGAPEAWLDTLGATARDRWTAWLAEHRARLTWSAADRTFAVK